MVSAAPSSAATAAPPSAGGGIAAVRNIHPGLQILLSAAQAAQQAAEVMLGKGGTINIII